MKPKTKPVERFKLYACIGGFRVRPEGEFADMPLLQQLCGSGPHALGRLLQGPLHVVVGMLMVEARRLGLEIEPKGRLNDPVLHLSKPIALKEVPDVVYPFADLRGRYAGHWSLTDLYPENKEALQAALDSGRPFDTGEFGAKKEIHYARVRREVSGGSIQLDVRCEADDGVALSDTAFWKAAGGNTAGDSGEDVLRRCGVAEEDIESELASLAEAVDIGSTNEARRQTALGADASFNDVMAGLEALVGEAERELEARSERLEAQAAKRLSELRGR